MLGTNKGRGLQNLKLTDYIEEKRSSKVLKEIEYIDGKSNGQ